MPLNFVSSQTLSAAMPHALVPSGTGLCAGDKRPCVGSCLAPWLFRPSLVETIARSGRDLRGPYTRLHLDAGGNTTMDVEGMALVRGRHSVSGARPAANGARPVTGRRTRKSVLNVVCTSPEREDQRCRGHM